MKTCLRSFVGVTALVLASLASCSSPTSNSAGGVRSLTTGPVSPSLGQASTFALFGGGAGMTNQGLKTVIQGDAGTTGSSTMVTGFHSGSFSYSETPLNNGGITGSVYTAPPQGSAADFTYATKTAGDALTAFTNLAAAPNGSDPGAGQLGGLTLAPGVYKSAAGPFLISGSDLTLDAQGNPNAIWIFQMASTLTVGTPSSARSVILLNGAQAKNVFWQVGSAAIINPAGGGTMVGTIIASAGISFSTAGNQTVTVLDGQALALFASVTLVNTVINNTGVPYTAPVVPITPAVGSPVVVTGTNAANVVPVVAGSGSINALNNGGLVTVTENGSGTINIVNNGGILTSTNTGAGVMTINSNATGAVTVTNTGNGKVTVNATGLLPVTITHTGDADFVYP